MIVFGTEIPRMMVFLVFAYVIITTAIAFRLGRPLIMLNFVNERLNANYRYFFNSVSKNMRRVWHFYAGEKVREQPTL